MISKKKQKKTVVAKYRPTILMLLPVFILFLEWKGWTGML